MPVLFSAPDLSGIDRNWLSRISTRMFYCPTQDRSRQSKLSLLIKKRMLTKDLHLPRKACEGGITRLFSRESFRFLRVTRFEKALILRPLLRIQQFRPGECMITGSIPSETDFSCYPSTLYWIDLRLNWRQISDGIIHAPASRTRAFWCGWQLFDGIQKVTSESAIARGRRVIMGCTAVNSDDKPCPNEQPFSLHAFSHTHQFESSQ
jgi:hypothetical protein